MHFPSITEVVALCELIFTLFSLLSVLHSSNVFCYCLHSHCLCININSNNSKWWGFFSVFPESFHMHAFIYLFIIINIVTSSRTKTKSIDSLFRNEFCLNIRDVICRMNDIQCTHIGFNISRHHHLAKMPNKTDEMLNSSTSLICFASAHQFGSVRLMQIWNLGELYFIIIPFLICQIHWSNEWYRFLFRFFFFLLFRFFHCISLCMPNFNSDLETFVYDSIVVCYFLLLELLLTTDQSLKRNEQFSNDFVTFCFSLRFLLVENIHI